MSKSNISNPRVIIAGGGLGGIMAAIKLKRNLGFNNFVIYEQSDDIGGTWKDNTYPGAASDIGTHWYSFSTDPNPDWPTSHVTQPELLAYWKSLSRKYNIYPSILCNTKVVSAVWDDNEQIYHVEVQDTNTKEIKSDYASILISATGLLSIPRYPEELKGIATFKGDIFHSARWNHNVDLHRKRVAVIGNGCSASQLLSVITQDSTTEVVNFCRSPHWILDNFYYTKFSSLQRWIFRNVPLVARLYRNITFLLHELCYVLVLDADDNSFIKRKIVESAVNTIKRYAPEKYHSRIIPNYPMGCKRIIFGTGYLEALRRPNMDINYDGIQQIVEDGIITKKGESEPFDVIIFATGFNAFDYPLEVRGQGGVSIQDYYNAKGGPEAYYGTALPHFPNFYMLPGFNTATGHGSAIFSEETQLNWAMKLIAPVLRGDASSFVPKEESSEAHNKKIQSELGKSVWAGGCVSWYRRPGSDKIHTNYPGCLTKFWWNLREPVWKDFKVVNGKNWRIKRTVVKRSARLGRVNFWTLCDCAIDPVNFLSTMVLGRSLL
ncbi:FMO family protein [Abortiporus biennis]